jgi:hypothetical protein
MENQEEVKEVVLTTEEKIKAKIEAVEKQKLQLVANLNAIEGALQVLNNLLEEIK